MANSNTAALAKVSLRVVDCSKQKANEFFQCWQQQQGIKFLQVEWKKQRILVHYDALLVSLSDIIAGLEAVKMQLKGGMFCRWRLHLARQVEQNIRDNLNHVPHCCGKAPRPIQGNK
ncbi:hypothetical protein [Marinomonas pollencensis]|uniref:Uncharacterized protein n=1 Tax=Marinomonas pollencensis TaxID=491954 RepID=A0A3E0DRF5_9GAMM|nr:hypothetical protein [Marinomonas pollencensis]REG85727.1 hypothetical protein DFP81_102260 [Marinomonas pollencensis]